MKNLLIILSLVFTIASCKTSEDFGAWERQPYYPKPTDSLSDMFNGVAMIAARVEDSTIYGNRDSGWRFIWDGKFTHNGEKWKLSKRGWIKRSANKN